jgi:hypothetical protein
MMIIYGHRSYGRVHGHRGEYAHTRTVRVLYQLAGASGLGGLVAILVAILVVRRRRARLK